MRILFNDIIIISFNLWSLSSTLVDYSSFFFILSFFRFIMRVDQTNDFFVFKLIESELFLLFLKNKFFPLQLILEFLSFSLESSNFLISLFLNISPLILKLLDLLLKLLNCLLANFFLLWFFFFQLILNFSNLLFLYDVLLMQFSNLLLLIIDLLYLLFSFLTELL